MGTCRVVVGTAAVVAAGAWSGNLILAAAVPRSPATDWRSAIQPRRGHLLELPPDVAPCLAHGLMEIDYAKVRLHIQLGSGSAPDSTLYD